MLFFVERRTFQGLRGTFGFRWRERGFDFRFVFLFLIVVLAFFILCM